MSRRNSKRRERRPGGTSVKQLPWRQLKNPYKPTEVISADHVEAIHDTSLRVLEELGIEFLSEKALSRLKDAGADVDFDTQMVRFDRDLVMELVGRAPSEFTLTPRNPDRAVSFGGNSIAFNSVGGPPNASDLDGGRRQGNFADYENFIRLMQSLNILHLCGGVPIAPIDLDAETRHLDCVQSILTLSDKVWHATGLGKQRVSDAIDMLCIARGKTREEIRSEPGIFTTINVNSPRRIDGPMLNGLMEAAENGQAVSVTPFTLSGAMSPSTIPGALVQQNAEGLAGIAFTQIIAPGAPVFYGGFTSNVDMKTGAPAFGTPEYTKACMVGGQLARRYNLPYRSSNTNASNTVDAQAAYESEMSIWGAVMGHANLLHHGAGWLEGGLTASFEKAILDAEMLQMMSEFIQPMTINDDSLAFEAIKEVQPGGHFFGAAHTLEHYETAFYDPMLSDWRNFETWEEDGSKTATVRANGIWKELLGNFEAPELDPAIAEELDAYVTRRKEEEANRP
ncbi:MAG: trimethylamine methyltransferase family protein [Alphaproteobacteria bacterium]|nr:trimethylamine methyltransferase family protein [Alphaproteobacteria bacterium]